jgi:type VI secretion system protein ImpF
MARQEPEPPITHSVLDRLLDLEPGAATDRPRSRGQAMRQLKDALRRDLEWLLNTRRDPEPLPEGAAELEHSLYNYGLPDISSFTVRSVADQNRLVQLLEAAVAIFEPRIMSARVTLEAPGASTHALRFQIQGLLRVDPAPERVAFDTVLELASGEYEVKGE